MIFGVYRKFRAYKSPPSPSPKTLCVTLPEQKSKNNMSNEIENHEKIYEKLISILNVKFKVQQKGTEIYFKNFYRMKNLISHKEDYLLILNEKKVFDL